jgi:LysR family cys regulon transcriptional activator
LGVEIFRRHGKRIRSLTEPGKRILISIEHILDEMETLKRVGNDFANQDLGNFVIATTHTQARYALPKVLSEFTKRFPKVRVSIQQGSPGQIAELLIQDRADIAIATEGIANTPGVLALPGFQWQHVLMVPLSHPLLNQANVSLEEIVKYPIITYDKAFAGRSKIDAAFAQRNLTPDIILEAIDADVIKTYVEIGMGIGIVAGLAYDMEKDRNLKVIPVGHLFGNNITHLGIKQGAYLRSFVYTFIELFSPTLTRKIVEQAMSTKADTYDI